MKDDICKRTSDLVKVVIGAQWGDESKGAIVDLLSQDVDIVARYNGGNNAGHTIVFGDKTYKLHSIPTGILQKNKVCYIGNGCVLDPENFCNEVDGLVKAGIKISPENLRIADNVPLILSVHRDLDKARETHASKGAKIGTTGRGIGPAYEDKVGRRAIRAVDISSLANGGNPSAELVSKLEKFLEYHNVWRKHFSLNELSVDDMVSEISVYADVINSYVTIVWKELDIAYQQGKSILLEAGQGVLLDIDHGTYPFVTSSNTTAQSAYDGLGFFPKNVHVIGVAKAYVTRVGNGPFPTKIDGELGEKIAMIGKELGTTTGRQRACGWLDLVALRQAVKVSGIDSLVLAKVDVLDGFESVKVATSYKLFGKDIDYIPSNLSDVSENLEPVYKTMPCWKNSSDIEGIDDIEQELRDFIGFIEDYVGVPVSILSFGPGREKKIFLNNQLSPSNLNIKENINGKYKIS